MQEEANAIEVVKPNPIFGPPPPTTQVSRTVLTDANDKQNNNVEQFTEWTGIYVMLNTEIGGTLFRWSPRIGFVGLGTESCGGVITDIQFGKVSLTKRYLRLSPEFDLFPKPNNVYRSVHLPLDLIPVKWGGAHYLIAKREIGAFCSDYVAGLGLYENTYVRPFMKISDENTDVLSKPILPDAYAHLSKKPLVTKVRSIAGYTFKKQSNSTNAYISTEVVLNVGNRSGVKKGMSFTLFDLEEDSSVFSRDIEIVSVKQNTSVGIFTRYLKDGDPQTLQQLQKTRRDYFHTVKIGMRACVSPIANVGTDYPYNQNK